MAGRVRKRRAVLGSCLAALLVGAVTPSASYAAEQENLPPAVQDLQTQSGGCASGDEPQYVRFYPVLKARLTDPAEDDRVGYPERVTAEFEIWWSDLDGTEQRRSWTTSPTPVDRVHSITLPSDIPSDTVISWHVRANDGAAYSPWSSQAPGASCRFVYDGEAPAPPVVNSPEYPADTWWGGGVGTYGSFTMHSPSADVVEYRYTFLGGPSGTVRPAEMGGPATIRYAPLSGGRRFSASTHWTAPAGRARAPTTPSTRTWPVPPSPAGSSTTRPAPPRRRPRRERRPGRDAA